MFCGASVLPSAAIPTCSQVEAAVDAGGSEMLESGTLGTSLFPPGKEGPLALEVGGGYNDTSISTFLTSAPEKVLLSLPSSGVSLSLMGLGSSSLRC